MPSGRAASLTELPERIASLLDVERRGVMSTIAEDGSAHAVPVVFARLGDEIVSPIDHKPKSGEILGRVKNLGRDDRVTLLIDHYDEDWTSLAWLMVRGRATVDPDAPLDLMRELNHRYPQYEPDERHDALIRIQPVRLSWWSWS
jgi:PPOX class probable F420-dependent enzyme